MKIYDNLIDALNDLKARGFTKDLKLNFNTIECRDITLQLLPSDFEISEFYRFEADTNPDDSSIVYAIQSADGNIKGTLVTAYGIYGDAVSDEMIQKLKVNLNYRTKI